jgi:colicin import membrane protein
MNRIALVMMLALSLGFLSACNVAQAPDQELAAAQAGLAAAKAANVDAATYPDMKKAEDSMSAAKAELDKQNGKFSFMRDYKVATSLLMDSKAASDKAMAAAKVAMEKAAAEKAAAEKAAAEKAAKEKAAKTKRPAKKK